MGDQSKCLGDGQPKKQKAHVETFKDNLIGKRLAAIQIK